MLFYFIRHGEPIYTPDALSELGHKQAEALAERLKYGDIKKIFSSTANRTMETAQHVSDALKLPIIQTDFANEGHAWFDFSYTIGEKTNWCYEFDSVMEKFNSKEVKDLGDEWYDYVPFRSTHFESGVNRVNWDTDLFFGDLGLEHDRKNKCFTTNKKFKDENVVLFSHAGFGMAFLSSVLDVPYPEICTRFACMTYTGVTVIEFKETCGKYVPRILTYSNDSHLLKAGIEPYNCYEKF